MTRAANRSGAAGAGAKQLVTSPAPGWVMARTARSPIFTRVMTSPASLETRAGSRGRRTHSIHTGSVASRSAACSGFFRRYCPRDVFISMIL